MELCTRRTLRPAHLGLQRRRPGSPAHAAPSRSTRRSSDIRQLIDVHPPVERAFLIGAPRKGTDDAAQVDEHLDELGRLADTAGTEVIGRAVQRIEAPNPSYYLGQGKVDELKAVLQKAGATLVLVDEPLSPVQGANLEKALGVRVMDRTEVILDIFATRARSHEAKMQVELAQLEYLLPRLTRLWTHLSRIRGGIGLRGPGETQLETDRRVIRRKIGVLRRRLEDVADHRANQRLGRRLLPNAALVGYTNAGKSSLLNALSGDALFVEDRLFATLDTATREVDVGGGYRVRLTDTVGFIRKLPHHLVASFRASLEEVSEADLLLHVIDASHAAWEDQAEVVDQELVRNAERGVRNGKEGNERKRVIYVFNKADLLPDPERFLTRVRERYPHSVLTSTVPHSALRTPHLEGVDGLRDVLRTSAQALRPVAEVRVPIGDGKLLAELHRDAEVMGQHAVDGVVVVTARVEASLLGRLRREGIAVEILG
jgi:GTP-binding protein HflX